MERLPLAHLVIKDLTEWVANNEKLQGAIASKDIKRLFFMEFPAELTIDLTAFNIDYYNKVFSFFPGKKNTDLFIKRVCAVVKKTLIENKIPEVMLSIHIKNKIRKEKRMIFISQK